jgi:hypothetical protein
MGLRHMNTTLQQQQHQQQGHGADAAQASASWSDSDLLLRLMASAGYTDKPPAGQHVPEGSSDPAKTLAKHLVCHNTVPQIDLVPVLAHTLGVAIPFGNLGKLPPHLFATLAAAEGSETDGGVLDWLPQYSAALAANAAQVNAYLNRYAAVGGLPAGQLAAVNQLYAALQQQQQQQQQSSADGGGPQGDTIAQLEALVVSQLQYLAAAADLARRRFTLFQQGPIWAGCGLGVLVLGLQLMVLR